MKQLKSFTIRFDKGFSFNSKESSLRVYLPECRLYYDFKVNPLILKKLSRDHKFSDVEDFNEWKHDIASRLEYDNTFYIVCPFASNEVTPTVSELIIFDIFASSLTAERVCKCFNDFYDQFLTMKPTMTLVDKVKKEMTASNFTFYYDLITQTFKLFYTNDQSIVFTVLSASSLSNFIMKIQDLLSEPNTKYWLKLLNYDINPKVDNKLLDNFSRLTTIQKLILELGVDNLPDSFLKFISENLFTNKVKDISMLMCQRDKKLKFMNSELLQVFKNERVSVKSVLCRILTEQ